MPNALIICLHQADDGDGIARFGIKASNGTFSCSTEVWSYAEAFGALAKLIRGFPVATTSAVDFNLGSQGVGQCKLSFNCLDGKGHIVVWITVESAYSFHPTSQHQMARLALRTEPAMIDIFYSELIALAEGRFTQASLIGCE
jgi:hypothetical protein